MTSRDQMTSFESTSIEAQPPKFALILSLTPNLTHPKIKIENK
jgi:hypothetical protein